MHPTVLDAIESVARAWPNVPDEPIFKAHNGFARYEVAEASRTRTTRPR
jgi:hypothetical protein